MADFTIEREGQMEFYKTFLPLVDSTIEIEDIIADDNDGVLNGNILEFKLNISDLNATLFQSVKYLSARRNKGKPVPANILLIDLNGENAYLYNSSDYLEDIEKTYNSSASKDNSGFIGKPYLKKYNYSNQLDASELIKILKTKHWAKIHIDENCIVGWATVFYKSNPSARKEDFLGDETGKHKTIGEIRNPTIFKEYIYPYEGQSNVKFQYLMDKLNDTLQKKNLGAFYTPDLYARKSHELLKIAIDRVPKGNDYVILDRCAGTGNLELGLPEEILGHCILSTIEYYEYKVLQELLGSKVRSIIPPIEAEDTFVAGLVRGANALSEEYINNPIIRKYVDNPKCTIILFENPPYAETTSIEHQKKKAGTKSSSWKDSFVVKEMYKDKKISGTALNDLGNAFIWSGFKYYLRQSTDSYVVYSPVKYWKVHHLINRDFIKGYAFNRRHFHTNIDACIMVALWSQKEKILDNIKIDAFDIENNALKECGVLDIKRIHSIYSDNYYDKRSFPEDIKGGIISEFDGTEAKPNRSSVRIKPITNDNIVGYLVIKGANFDNPDSCVHLTRVGAYDANGFYVRKDALLDKLPLFCGSRYITYNREWTERARIMKSADGAELYKKDLKSGILDQWLLKCLLFTCMEMQNHIRSFTGSDGRYYRNELCLDTSNGDTIASKEISKLKLNEEEKKILFQWDQLITEVKRTKEYDPKLTYGTYQIFSEIDTSYEDEDGKTIWNNVEVHSALQTLKALIKDYYNDEIVPVLFRYEFLK